MGGSYYAGSSPVYWFRTIKNFWMEIIVVNVTIDIFGAVTHVLYVMYFYKI
jgi:hypothetical protein